MTNPASPPPLVRALGRWTMVALVINAVLGSAIFGLPGNIVKLVGSAAPLAYLLSAAAMLVFIAVFAELSSQFSEPGGPYLYAREAFGRFWGIEMGWFIWLVRLTAAAANANLFVIYLGEFWPAATSPLPRALVLAALLGGLMLVNYRGVSGAARLSNVFTAAKLLPLALLIVAGFALAPSAPVASVPEPAETKWLGAFLILLFTYGGFETALIPAGECRDARRDLPFALGIGLAVITGIYVLLQVVAMRTVPDLVNSARPLADAARVLVGPWGAAFIALGAMISTSGYLSAQLLAVPRLTMALAQRGDFPAPLGAVHPVHRTPHLSILAWGALAFGLALYGSFTWNVALYGAARLLTYGLSCAALLKLRRSRPDAPALRIPGGYALAILGLVLCALMMQAMELTHLWAIAIVASIAGATWLMAKRKS